MGFIVLLVAFLVIFSLPGSAYAKVVINEVFPNPSGDSAEKGEFIELYNTDDKEEVVLTGFKLSEAKTYEIQDMTIPPLGFVSFERGETGLALNNSGDTLSLVDTDGKLIDTFEYDTSIEDKSWSRIPDGTGEFMENTDASENLPNIPPPSPIPTPTLVPTAVPTDTPISTVTLSPTKTPSPTITSGQLPTEEIDNSAEKINQESDVLSDITTAFEDNENKSIMENVGDIPSEKISSLPIFFIVGGISFLVSGFIYFFKR